MTVFDVGETDGVHYFASELVEGSDLRQLLEGGPLPIKRVLGLAEQIASGLAAAGTRSMTLVPARAGSARSCRTSS